MTKVEKGQVWKDKLAKSKMVVVKLENNSFTVLYENGLSIEKYFNFFPKIEYELLATYPTWQEAVNSPEFMGTSKEILQVESVIPDIREKVEEMTWEELKELQKGIRWKNSVGSTNPNVICLSLPNCSMSYLKFYREKIVEVIIYNSANNKNYNRLLTTNKTPAQMYQLIKILGS